MARHFLLKSSYISMISIHLQQIFIQNNPLKHSHKKRKDSLEGSLDRVLIAAELDFPKILIPRLPSGSSNVYTECAGKSKQLYCLCDQLLGALI